jgi:hypothetical protein
MLEAYILDAHYPVLRRSTFLDGIETALTQTLAGSSTSVSISFDTAPYNILP